MEKKYTITYKTYFNQRLKQISFHGKLTKPLYVQVTFDRKTIFFKSYYFDLFVKLKYASRVSGQSFAPDIKEIIKKEKSLIEFIIDKNINKFSLDLFKKEYNFYSRDLLDIMEEGYLEYLHTFFHDEGMPFIAETLRAGALGSSLYDLTHDLKKALSISLYKKLLENSFYYAPPYLPLYQFTENMHPIIVKNLSVMEWEGTDTKEKFVEFFNENYPNKNLSKMMEEIQKWVLSKLNT